MAKMNMTKICKSVAKKDKKKNPEKENVHGQ